MTRKTLTNGAIAAPHSCLRDARDASPERAPDHPPPLLSPPTDRKGVPEAGRRQRRVRIHSLRLPSPAFRPESARRDEKLIRENTRSPRPSLPTPADSPLPPRRRRPARLAPATTRTSVSASRLPARLLRVRAVAAVPRARSRPARTHRGRVGLSLCGRAKGFFRRCRGRGTVRPLSSHPADLPLSLSDASLARQARTSTRSAPSPATCPSAGAS